VICLIGALAGYILTVIAIETSSYILLLVGRAISGFTAGNQPIAQAALIDISRNDDERTRNMGKVVAASALGLVAGPLIAGLLRSCRSSLPPSWSSSRSCSSWFFFHDTRTERREVDFGVTEVFLNLWRIRHRPTIIKLAVVWFFFELGLNAFFIYMDNYMIEVFRFDTLQNSILMTVFGLTMAFASGDPHGRGNRCSDGRFPRSLHAKRHFPARLCPGGPDRRRLCHRVSDPACPLCR
jgi:MFS family permease